MPVLLNPVKEGLQIVLDKPILLIGRHQGCDVILKRSRKVSRKHCCVARSGDRFLIRDLGSRNGVWVNGCRVDGEAEIKVGDEVSIGDVVYQLEQTKDVSRGRKNGKPQNNRAAPEGEARESSDAPSPPDSVPHDLSQDFPVPIPEDDEQF